MAIVQISRITQRKGLEVDLPQPLAGAELGWAVDQRRLFIGNGELADGAPVIGNTEILTEFSDILAFTTAYTYQGQAAGYTVQTGPSSTPITQSLQAWMDQWASVKDFGAKGDGVTDDTEAINRALFQLYCRQVNPQIRRSLFFPAGVYVVSGTINVPPYCKLYGDGTDGSIISFQVQIWTDAVFYPAGVLVIDIVTGNYYRSLIPVDPGVIITNPIYWEATTLPECVVRTADSLQQTGAEIGSNGALPPQYISLDGITITTDSEHDCVLVEKCVHSNFDNVNIRGPLTTADLNTATPDTCAVAWSSSPSLVCSDISFSNCEFGGFIWASKTDQQIGGVIYSECLFDTLYQGLYFGGATPVLGGATGIRIMHSVFDNIYAQGIVFDTVELNASGYNIFYDVGNHFNGITFPATSIIDINADQNISVGDMFQRTTLYAETYPRININNSSSIAFTNAYKQQLGTYTRYTGAQNVLVDNTSSPASIFTIDADTIRAFRVDYTITRGTATKTGTLTVVASTSGAGGDLSVNDAGFENTSTGITITVTETASTVTVAYTSTLTGIDAQFYYSITSLA